MRMGSSLNISSLIVGSFLIGGLAGCSPGKQGQIPESITAKEEIALLSKQINAQEQYRITDEDLALLEQNGLLNDQVRASLDLLSKK